MDRHNAARPSFPDAECVGVASTVSAAKPVPKWTFRAPVSVSGCKALDIFHTPPLYNNWTLINDLVMEESTQRGAWTRMDTYLGPIPGEFGFWSIDVAAKPQTQTVNYPLGSSNCKIFNVTKGFYSFPER